MPTQVHVVTFHENTDPRKFRWEAHCSGCSWSGVGPSKECVEIIAAGHDLDDDLSPAKEDGETIMLRTDHLLTRENLIDFFSMLSQPSRDAIRKEVHEAHQAATDDVAKERDGTREKTQIQEQVDLSLLILQALDSSSGEFSTLGSETVHISKAVDLKSGSTPHKPGNEPDPKTQQK